MCTGKCGDFAAEISPGSFDPLAERKALETADLDRRPDFAFGLLERLRDAFLFIEDEGLIEQTDLLVESLQARLDDLVDDIGGLALRLELVGKNVLLALDACRIESQTVVLGIEA